jgi:hypothetical protein
LLFTSEIPRATVLQFLYIRNIPEFIMMCRHTVLTLFARYFVVLKSNTCGMHVMHVGGNSKTVINAARSNGFGKQSVRQVQNRVRQDLRKKPKHFAILIRKLLPFLFIIYTAVYATYCNTVCQ